MKKLLALILSFLMLSCMTAVMAEEIEFDDDSNDPVGYAWVYTGPKYEYDRLTVGNTTALSGKFATQMFGGNTADLDVYALLNDYNLVKWDYDEGLFVLNDRIVSNAESLQVYVDEQGNRTYPIALDGLKDLDITYSDGTPITAYDYAFSILLQTSPEAASLGANNQLFRNIRGIDEYQSGSRNYLSGVKVVNKYLINITISSDMQPFFYELGLLWCYPMPIHVIAPGCEVRNDGLGSYITGDFSADLLNQTLLDEKTGYLTHPSVISGPYQLTSFDGVTAEFEINRKHADPEGLVDDANRIQYLTYTLAENETAIEKLAAGEFGLLNKLVNKDTVSAGIQLIGDGNYSMKNYARAGISNISFCCEKPTVSSKAVRQAIAYCLDKPQLVSDYAGDYGLPVNGYYGIAQWMYQVITGAASVQTELPENATDAEIRAYEQEQENWKKLSLGSVPVYDLNIEEAARLLDQDGWELQDGIRTKDIDGRVVRLELTMIYPEGNTITESFEKNFVSNLEQVGIKLELVPVEMNGLLSYLHRENPRSCDMVYLATNFDEVFEPSATFDPADAETGRNNYSAVTDQELYQAALEMSKTEPGQMYEYETKWIAFQEKFMEVLPMIPVYSNAYFDFHTCCLQNYSPNENVTWSEAIQYAYMSDAPMESEAEDGEEFFE